MKVVTEIQLPDDIFSSCKKFWKFQKRYESLLAKPGGFTGGFRVDFWWIFRWISGGFTGGFRVDSLVDFGWITGGS